MKNGVECCKDFFPYFKALKTNCDFVVTKVDMYYLFAKTILFEGEHDYLRMLREAQRESNRSSSKVSPISSAFISVKTTPAGS